jgi:hypothetical protein
MLSSYYDQGVEDFHAGREVNPYDADLQPNEANEWDNGFQDASFDDA